MFDRVPRSFFDGRLRLSTVLLAALFVGVLFLYLDVRPVPDAVREREERREQRTTTTPVTTPTTPAVSTTETRPAATTPRTTPTRPRTTTSPSGREDEAAPSEVPPPDEDGDAGAETTP